MTKTKAEEAWERCLTDIYGSEWVKQWHEEEVGNMQETFMYAWQAGRKALVEEAENESLEVKELYTDEPVYRFVTIDNLKKLAGGDQ
jgi:hypothetical protein